MSKNNSLDPLRDKFVWPTRQPAIPHYELIHPRSFSYDPIRWIVDQFTGPIHRILEIGADSGNSTTVFAQCFPDADIIVLNEWLSTEEKCMVNDDDTTFIALLFERFFVNTWEFRNRIIPMRMHVNRGLVFLFEMNVPLDLIFYHGDRPVDQIEEELLLTQKIYPNVPIAGNSLKNECLQTIETFFIQEKRWLTFHGDFWKAI